MPLILRTIFIMFLLISFSPTGFCASIFVDENGDLGIGRSNLIYDLSIHRNSGVWQHFTNDQTGQTSSDGMLFGISKSGNVNLLNRENTNIYFYTNNTVRAIIKNDGCFGIGTTTPAYKLDVSGTIRGSNVSPSDARWKTNINTIENSLEKVSKLRGVTYEWTDSSKGAGEQIGVIAQEVEEIFPEAVSTDNEGYKSVAYSKLVAPLIESIKELKNENDYLKNQLSEIKMAVEELSKKK